MVILEQVLAKFVYAHAFGLSPFDQASQRRFVKDNFQPVLALKVCGKLPRARLESFRFVRMIFGHETLQHSLRLTDKIDSHP